MGTESIAFRRTGPRWWLTMCTSLFFLIFLSGVFVSGGPDTSEGASAVQAAICAPLALASLWVMIRVFRQGVFADPNGLLIRNVLHTRRFAWNEIEGFTEPASYGTWSNPGIGVLLTAGRKFSANLYSAGPMNRPGFANDVVQELRALHARYTGS